MEGTSSVEYISLQIVFYFNLNIWQFELQYDGLYHKYFSKDIAFYNYFVTM